MGMILEMDSASATWKTSPHGIKADSSFWKQTAQAEVDQRAAQESASRPEANIDAQEKRAKAAEDKLAALENAEEANIQRLQKEYEDRLTAINPKLAPGPHPVQHCTAEPVPGSPPARGGRC